jgi:hypothetical protein
MNGDRLNGRYCVLETADHSERAATSVEKLPRIPPRGMSARMVVRRETRSLNEFAALYWFTGD